MNETAPLAPAPPGTTVNGFRLRGSQVSRLEGFSDAVFGFAVTLLVVSLEVPRTFDELSRALRGLPAFAVCFALFLQIWRRHHLFFRRYALEDTTTVWLNGLLLLLVLAFVYPLKFLFGLLGAQLTSQPLDVPGPGGALVPPIRPEQVPALFYVYGVGFTLVSGVLALMHLHAWRMRERLDLDRLERFDALNAALEDGLVASVGLVSVAVMRGTSSALLSGSAYWLIGPVMTVHGMVSGRRRRALRARLAAEGAARA